MNSIGSVPYYVRGNKLQSRMWVQMKKRFCLSSELPKSECVERFATLLGEEGVAFQHDNQCVRSTSTPIAIISVDRRLYSRNNWVGVNPFVFVSGIEINVSSANALTQIDVVIDQKRTMAIYGLVLGLVFIVARALPSNGVIFFLSASAVLLLLFRFFAGSLIKQEFEKRLRRDS